MTDDERKDRLRQAQEDFATASALSNKHKAMTPEVLLERFGEYRLKVKGNPFLVQDYVGKDGNEVDRKKEKPLTMEGFENFLYDNYGLGQIQQYLENREGRYADYVDAVRYIKRSIREDQISGGMANVYNANITARLNGLSDTIETKGDNVKLLNIDPL